MIGMFLNQTLIRASRGVNALGKIISEDELTIPCRHEVRTERTFGPGGERIVERHRVYTLPGADIQANDRIVVQGVSGTGGLPDEWVVQSVFQARGFGPSHLEVNV